MKLDQPTDNDRTLYDIDETLQTQILDDTLWLLHQPDGIRRIKGVVSGFHAFVNAFDPDYLYGKEDELNKNFAMGLATHLAPDDFFAHITATVDEEYRDDALILFQHALTYAIAKEFKSEIPKVYMRASQAVQGTIKADHSDNEYTSYIKASHPDVAAYVITNNKLFSKKILAIIGYMINPTLQEKQ